MDFKQMNYILAIAKEQNITHAAEKLYITRAALNYSLLNLEKELGFPLFNRFSHKMLPTYAGELYIQKAQQILNTCNELDHIMHDIANSAYGRINLGITVGGGQKILMEIFSQFQEKYPNHSLNLIEGNVIYLEKKLLDGTIDLAWSGFTNTNPLLDYMVTKRSSSFRLAIAKNHPSVQRYHLLDRTDEYIDLSLFKNDFFILMNKDTFVRKHIDRFFSFADFHPKIMMECSRLDMVKHFLKQGTALGFLPEQSNTENLLLLKLKPDLEDCHQTVFFRKNQVFTEAEKYLIHLYIQNQQLSSLMQTSYP